MLGQYSRGQRINPLCDGIQATSAQGRLAREFDGRGSFWEGLRG